MRKTCAIRVFPEIRASNKSKYPSNEAQVSIDLWFFIQLPIYFPPSTSLSCAEIVSKYLGSLPKQRNVQTNEEREIKKAPNQCELLNFI
jgi:hypothetical protein